MIDSVTGVILAGGKSTRMGASKAFLPYRGKNLIDAPIDALTAVFHQVVLSVRHADDFAGYPLPGVIDEYPEIGPMGGITSVLKKGYSQIFCVACDMPFLNERLMEHLCTFAGYDAVIPVWDGREQVLHALYSGALIPDFEASIARGRYKVTDALQSARVLYVQQEEIQRFDPAGECFKNVNTPEDYEKL